MSLPYKVLTRQSLPKNTPIHHPITPEVVHASEPALSVMTDLKATQAFTLTANIPIDEALQKMIHCGIRMLLVVDPDDNMVGLITSRDIMGDKPVNFASKEKIPRVKICVGDIMTPLENVYVLPMKEVERAVIGDIVVTLRETGNQHALVAEAPPDGKIIIRGLFSTTHIGYKLGLDIQPTGVVQSFAELEEALQR